MGRGAPPAHPQESGGRGKSWGRAGCSGTQGSVTELACSRRLLGRFQLKPSSRSSTRPLPAPLWQGEPRGDPQAPFLPVTTAAPSPPAPAPLCQGASANGWLFISQQLLTDSWELGGRDDRVVGSAVTPAEAGPLHPRGETPGTSKGREPGLRTWGWQATGVGVGEIVTPAEVFLRRESRYSLII